MKFRRGGGFGKRPARKRSGRASLLILFDRWKNTFSFLSSILTFHPLHVLFQSYILCYKGISNQLDKHLKVKSGSNNFFLKYFINAVCFTPSLDRHCSNFRRIKLIIAQINNPSVLDLSIQSPEVAAMK